MKHCRSELRWTTLLVWATLGLVALASPAGAQTEPAPPPGGNGAPAPAKAAPAPKVYLQETVDEETEEEQKKKRTRIASILRAGEFGACENFAADRLGTTKLPPGTSLGYNGAAGGVFAEAFVAHVSQLAAVPDELPDELALLTDPVACSLHAVLRLDLTGVQRVLIYGAGMLGLAAVAALRAVGYRGRIDALDRQDYLADLAADLGADEYFLLPDARRERFEQIARRTGGTVQRARFGNYMLSGGYDVVFECVGARQSIDESLRWTRSCGQVVLLATGHGRGVDLTPIWFTELTVLGAYGRQIEQFEGRQIGTYQLVHELMAAGKLEVAKLLTHTFGLGEYRQAFDVGLNKGRHRAIKVAFDMR